MKHGFQVLFIISSVSTKLSDNFQYKYTLLKPTHHGDDYKSNSFIAVSTKWFFSFLCKNLPTSESDRKGTSSFIFIL